MNKIAIAFAAVAAFGSAAFATETTTSWFDGNIGGEASGGAWTVPSEGVTLSTDKYVLDDPETPLKFTATTAKEVSAAGSIKIATGAKFMASYDELPAVDAGAKAGVVVANNKYYVLAKDSTTNNWVDTALAATIDAAVAVEVTVTNGADGAHALYKIGDNAAIDKLVVASGAWSEISYSGSGEVTNLLGSTITYIEPVAEVDGVPYGSLAEAISAAAAGKTVKMVANANLTAALTLDKALTLDLNGKTISGGWATSYENPGSGRQYLFEVTDSVTVSNGFITSESANIGAFHAVGTSAVLALNSVTNTTAWRAIGAYDGATVTVDANSKLTTTNEDPTIFVWSNFTNRSDENVQCHVTIAGEVYNTFAGPRTCSNLDAVIMGNGNDKFAGVALTISDGAVIAGTACAGIYFPCAGTLAINAATISGTEGVYVKGGAATIVNGATINGNGAASVFAVDHNGHAWTGDAFVVDVSEGYPTVATQSITGGTFTSANGYAVASYKEAKATADLVTGFVTGGLFKGAKGNANTDAVLGAAYAFGAADAQGYSSIVAAVAQVGDNKYETLAAALAAAKSGAVDKISMLKDVGLTSCLQVIDYTGTLDLNGHSLSNDASYVRGSGNTYLMEIAGNSDFTVTNGTVTVKDGLMLYVYSYATFTVAANTTIDTISIAAVPNVIRLYGKTIGLDEEDTATMNVYGTITRVGDYGADWGNGTIDQCVGDTVLNVYDGAVISHENGGSAYVLKLSGGTAHANIYGGTINGGWAFHAYNGPHYIDITGGTFNAGKLFTKVSQTDINKIHVTGLGEGCEARFSSNDSDLESLAYFCEEGYEPAKQSDNYYHIVKASYPVPGGSDPIPAERADDWAAEQGIPEEDVAKVLADNTDYNGRTAAESCILGVSTNEVITSTVVDTNATKLTFSVNCTPITGRAKFSLKKDGSTLVADNATTDFNVDLADGVYKIVAQVDGANKLIDVSKEIGVKSTAVASGKVVYLAVPWSDCAVTNLLKNSICGDGDKLEVYDVASNSYKTWQHNGTKWVYAESGAEPTLVKGQAVKYTRAGEAASMVAVGEVSAATSTAIVKGADKWNLVAKPDGSIKASALPMDTVKSQVVELGDDGVHPAKIFRKVGGKVYYKTSWAGTWTEATDDITITNGFFLKTVNTDTVNW